MEEKQNKNAGLKYFLFIGIPVIIVLGVLGAYYYATNPITVLTRTINVAYEKLDKIIKEEQINIKDNPFAIKGNFKINTDLDFPYKEVLDYNYSYNIGMDYPNEQMNIELGMNKEEQNILNATLYQLKEKQYLKSEKITTYLLDITSDNQTNLFESFNEEFFQKTTTKNNKLIIKKLKNILLNSLDEKYIEREKSDIKIDDQKIKTTKITYILDKENQKRTIEYICNKILEDNEFIQEIADYLQLEKQEVIDELENTKNNFTYEEEMKINLYTEGINQNVVKISILEDDKEIITYTDFKNNKKINFKNNLELTINEFTEKKIDLDYNLKENDFKGTIKAFETEKQKYNITFSINSKEINLSLDLDLAIDQNVNLEKPDIENAKNANELSNEEILEIFTNLENCLKDTIFYNFLEDNIM